MEEGRVLSRLSHVPPFSSSTNQPNPKMSESDPLLALRQAVQNKSSITFAQKSEPCSSLAAATHIVISGHAFPKSTSTRFLAGSGSSSSSTRDTYSLAALYLAWAHKNSPGAEYMKQAREGGLLTGFVSVTERKGVVDWLEGTVEDRGRIQPVGYVSTTPPGTPPRSAHQRTLPSTTPSKPSTSSFSSATTPAKRRYVPDPHDAEVVKKIKLQEVELRNRDSVLQGSKANVSLAFLQSVVRPYWDYRTFLRFDKLSRTNSRN